ncbi:hypothetical protein Taro_005382 [Colocasia esculenta]|uniref:Retrotransposon gag domain-containing protein n=1 Tax=Colocasia esculenta TaxID=4460 RepID=A0A843TU76_COLES|nr:hypothetical protein [Colocasia esculenta]
MNGMGSKAETLRKMQWMEIATFTGVSYPDLVKAFYVCLRSEEDGSLVSSVKGIQIKVDHELLHMLFGVKTSGFSGIHTVNDEAKGLGIIGPGFRLRDDVSGAVVEKMGQCIRSKNLKKSGFSVIGGVWSKTTVAEGEAIIGDLEIPDVQEMAAEAPAVQQPAEASVAPTEEQQEEAPAAEQQEEAPAAEQQEEALAAEQQEEAPAAEQQATATAEFEFKTEQRIDCEPAASSAQEELVAEELTPAVEKEILDKANDLPTSIIGSILKSLVESALSTPVHPRSGETELEKAVAEGHIEESVPVEQSSAPADPVEEDAPIQGEQMEAEVEAPTQGEHITEEPTPQKKIKRVVHRKHRKSHRKVNLKPVLELLKAQGEILSAVQTSVQSIIASQASTTSELSSVRNAMRWFNKEMADMKSMLAVISRSSGISGPSATQSRPIAVPRSSGPSAQESGPSGPAVQGSGPSGPSDQESGPSEGTKEDQDKGKEPAAATLTHIQKSKIFDGTEFKTEEQWANVKGNKSQYSKYLTARVETLTHRDHPLTLSEWFVLQHKTSWGPFILKEIRVAKNFQLYSDFCYLNKIPEVQFSQFHSTIVALRTEHPVNLPLTCEGRPGGIQGVFPFSVKEDLVVSTVCFPSGVKEDQLSWVLLFSWATFRSPFSGEILEARVSPKLPLPTIAPYDGTTDPADHIRGFESHMVFHGASDAAKCRAFPATFKETARAWFETLPAGSITSFCQLKKSFRDNFLGGRSQPQTAASLLAIRQKKGEALWDFVKRFRIEALRVSRIDVPLSTSALIQGTRDGFLQWTLGDQQPATLAELLSIAQRHAACEESLAAGRAEQRE